jgi:hypothetical protein
VLIALFAAPLFLESRRKPLVRFLIGCGYAAATVGVWLGGLTAANVQLLCRLF